MEYTLSSQSVFIEHYIHSHILFVAFVSGFMLLIYDHVLTFSLEVECIWKRRFTLPALFFYVLRYSTIVEMILSLIVFVPGIFNSINCAVFLRAVNVFNVFSVFLISATMAIRIMALYNWTRTAALTLGGLLSIHLVCLAFFTAETKFVSVPMKAACVVSQHTSYITVLWWSPLMVDTILIGLTLYRIYRLRSFSTQHNPLLRTLQQDGMLYYGVICIAYTANLINYYVNPHTSRGAGSVFGIVLPAVMICRLILNLQGLPAGSAKESSDETTMSGELTTLPSRFLIPSKHCRTWFVDDQWGTILSS